MLNDISFRFVNTKIDCCEKFYFEKPKILNSKLINIDIEIKDDQDKNQEIFTAYFTLNFANGKSTKFKAINEHNGYYPHEVVISSKKMIKFVL
jgi:hypothetical protein